MTDARRYRIDPMRADDVRAADVALARAFYDDVLFAWAVPDPVRRARALVHFMASTVHDGLPFGETSVARPPEAPAEGRVAGIAAAAVWLPPGAYPRGNRRDLAMLRRVLPGLVATGARTPGLVRMLNRVDVVHLHEPHWYLALLGVDPAFQGTGAGGALLAPVLQRCDDDALPAYLETQKPENLSWYGRFGFEVVERVEAGRCPPIWTLQRTPR